MMALVRPNEDAARAAVPLLLAAGLEARHVGGDLVEVEDGRGVRVEVAVRRASGVVDAVWKLLDRCQT